MMGRHFFLIRLVLRSLVVVSLPGCASSPAPPLAPRRAPPMLMSIAQPVPSPHRASRDGQGQCRTRLSPDGKWRLTQVGGGESACTARAVDGSRSIRRKLPPGQFWTDNSNKIWLRDSRSWVGLMAGHKSLYAVVQSVDTPGAARSTPIGFPRWTRMFPDLMPTDLLGLVGEDRVLAKPHQDGWSRGGRPREVPFYEFSASSGAANLREYSVELPAGTDDGEVALSPDGRQVAWVLYVVPEDAQGNRGQLQAIQLAISNTDGSAMRILGTIPREPRKAGRTGRLDPFWLPTGKHLGFFYDGQEWLVPVAPPASTAQTP